MARKKASADNDDARAAYRGDCAYADAGCKAEAVFHVKRPGGRVDLCKRHYELAADIDAQTFCEARGIFSGTAAHAYAMQKQPGIGGRAPGLWWARQIIARVDAGENMPHISQHMARAALAHVQEKEAEPERTATRQREPGADENEEQAEV